MICASLAVGDYAEADQRILAIVNIAPSLGDEPICVTILTRCAIIRMTDLAIFEWLAKSEPNEGILRQVQRTLELEAEAPLATMYAKGERAAGFESFEQLFGLAPPPANPWQAFQFLLGSSYAKAGFIPRQKAYHLKTMNRLVEITNGLEEKQLDQFAICKDNIPQDAIMARLMMPPIEKILTAIHRVHADQRCVIVALAAERFRIQKRRWPETDEMVATGFLTSVPLDPFDGKPLRWKTTENGRLIYSIGQDRTDNDGAYDWEKSTEPGNDIIFRLYDPAHRRLPPLPPKPKKDE